MSPEADPGPIVFPRPTDFPTDPGTPLAGRLDAAMATFERWDASLKRWRDEVGGGADISAPVSRFWLRCWSTRVFRQDPAARTADDLRAVARLLVWLGWHTGKHRAFRLDSTPGWLAVYRLTVPFSRPQDDVPPVGVGIPHATRQ